jgi:hypothetical protein
MTVALSINNCFSQFRYNVSPTSKVGWIKLYPNPTKPTKTRSCRVSNKSYMPKADIEQTRGWNVMNMDKIGGLLRGMGFVFLILGLVIAVYYILQATAYSSNGHLLDTLRYMCLGMAFELFGLGLMIVGRK